MPDDQPIDVESRCRVDAELGQDHLGGSGVGVPDDQTNIASPRGQGVCGLHHLNAVGPGRGETDVREHQNRGPQGHGFSRTHSI